MKNKIIAGIAVLFCVFLDQWTKLLAVRYLKGKNPIVLLDGVFELSYLENRGAAFGIFQNQRWIFIVFTIVIMAALLIFYWKLPNSKRYLPMQICCVVIFAGAVGNMIDRLQNGYVVDFFYFRLINFPVFNVADIYVTGATIIAAIFFLFYYKEEEWTQIWNKKG